MSKGVKYDQGKAKMELLSPEALVGLAQVMTFGATKYGGRNWEQGLVYSRVIGAILRHTMSIMQGVDKDEESGLLHVDHLMANAMFLSHFMHKGMGKEFDDRSNSEDDLDIT